jgi:hypothetical protein
VILRAGVVAVAILGLAPVAAPGQGTEPGFLLGLRGDVVGSDGEPANDMLGGSLTGRFRLSDRWSLDIAVGHSPGFDVETPYAVLDLAAAEVDGEVLDAEGTATALTGWIERTYVREGRRLEWYWGAGVGAATVDVDPIAGPLVGGGSFALHQEVGTELIAGLTGGFRLRLGMRWRLVVAGRLEQHFTDWEVVDRVSGRRGEFDDYLVKGVSVGFEIGI